MQKESKRNVHNGFWLNIASATRRGPPEPPPSSGRRPMHTYATPLTETPRSSTQDTHTHAARRAHGLSRLRQGAACRVRPDAHHSGRTDRDSSLMHDTAGGAPSRRHAQPVPRVPPGSSAPPTHTASRTPLEVALAYRGPHSYAHHMRPQGFTHQPVRGSAPPRQQRRIGVQHAHRVAHR